LKLQVKRLLYNIKIAKTFVEYCYWWGYYAQTNSMEECYSWENNTRPINQEIHYHVLLSSLRSYYLCSD